MPEKTVSFIREKETKNTVKFQEQPAEGEAPICGTLYLQKYFARDTKIVQVTVVTE